MTTNVTCFIDAQSRQHAVLHGQMTREEWIREHIAPEFEVGLLAGSNIEQVVDGLICSEKEQEFYQALSGVVNAEQGAISKLTRLLQGQAEVIAMPLAEAEAKRREALRAEDKAMDLREAG